MFIPLGESTLHSVFAAVVINEVYPKTDDVTQTWIELYNNGNEAVSMDRWRIENTFGNQSSFTLNASALIPGKSFFTLKQSQYGFTLNKEGDSIRLFDASNNKVDEQSYQGIIGYYQSMGRSTDGEGVWTNCTNPTQHSPNECIAPPPTATPLPTETPGPTMTPFPTDAPMIVSTVSATPGQILAISSENVDIMPTPTPTPTPAVKSQSFPYPKGIFVIVTIVIVWIIIIGTILLRRKRNKNEVT